MLKLSIQAFKYLLLLILICFAHLTFAQSWEQKSLDINKNINAIDCIGEANAIAVTQSFTLRTIDGDNWDYESYSGYLFDVAQVDANTAYAVGDFNSSKIVKTTNGGVNWVSMNLPFTNKAIHTVFFVNSSTGYAFGQSGAALKYNGTSWSPITSPEAGKGYDGCYFTNSYTGYVVGTHDTNYNPIIYKTSNGGNSWTPKTPTFSPGFGGRALSVAFSKQYPHIGYAVGLYQQISGGQSYGLILKTTDGGETWEGKAYNSVNQLKSVAFSDGTTVYAVGSNGTIIRNEITNTTLGNTTTDNWQKQTVPNNITENLNDICFSENGKVGWIVGDNGIILKSEIGRVTLNLPNDDKLFFDIPNAITYSWNTNNNPPNTTYILRVRKRNLDGTYANKLVVDNRNVGNGSQITLNLSEHNDNGEVLEDMSMYEWNITAILSGDPIPKPGDKIEDYPDAIRSNNHRYRIGVIYSPVLGNVVMSQYGGNTNTWAFYQRKDDKDYEGHSFSWDENCKPGSGNFVLSCNEAYKFVGNNTGNYTCKFIQVENGKGSYVKDGNSFRSVSEYKGNYLPEMIRRYGSAGIRCADDDLAWDCNLLSQTDDRWYDNFQPIYVSEEGGQVSNLGGWTGNSSGQILLKFNDGLTDWYMGILHAEIIVNKNAYPIDKWTKIGVVGPKGVNNSHLHIALYKLENGKLVSKNKTFLKLADIPPIPTTNYPGLSNEIPELISRVFSWNPPSNLPDGINVEKYLIYITKINGIGVDSQINKYGYLKLLGDQVFSSTSTTFELPKEYINLENSGKNYRWRVKVIFSDGTESISQDFKYFKITGNTVQILGSILSGAKVSVKREGVWAEVGYTNENGKLLIVPPLDSQDSIRVEAPTYETITSDASFFESGNQTILFPMFKTEDYDDYKGIRYPAVKILSDPVIKQDSIAIFQITADNLKKVEFNYNQSGWQQANLSQGIFEKLLLDGENNFEFRLISEVDTFLVDKKIDYYSPFNSSYQFIKVILSVSDNNLGCLLSIDNVDIKNVNKTLDTLFLPQTGILSFQKSGFFNLNHTVYSDTTLQINMEALPNPITSDSSIIVLNGIKDTGYWKSVSCINRSEDKKVFSVKKANVDYAYMGIEEVSCTFEFINLSDSRLNNIEVSIALNQPIQIKESDSLLVIRDGTEIEKYSLLENDILSFDSVTQKLNYKNINALNNEKLVIFREIFEIDNVLSIDEINSTTIELYPNPNEGVFMLEFGELQSQIIELVLHDIHGNIVKEFDLNKANKAIEVKINDLNSGIYFLTIKTGQTSIVKKILLQK